MEEVMLHLGLGIDVLGDIIFVILAVILFVFTIVLNIVRVTSITIDLLSLILILNAITTILDRLLFAIVLLISHGLLHHTAHIATILILIETTNVDFPILKLGGRFLVSAVLD